MPKIIFNFDKVDITYNLVENSETVGVWKGLMDQMSIDLLCKNDNKIGFNTVEEVLKKTERFYEVANAINSIVPGGIEVIELNESNWKEALNKMHIHFPMIASAYNISPEEFSKRLFPLLAEYNDTIHQLEKEYDWMHGLKISNAAIFNDFNKSPLSCSIRALIPNDGYSLFTHSLPFGSLTIHYAHIGRHPFELFTARDYDCPAEQVVCQFLMAPTCGMYFMDRDLYRQQTIGGTPEYQHEKVFEQFKEFYAARGGKDFFGYEIDDPRLAFGYMKIGQLENIELYANDRAKRDELRETLRTSELLGWKFED